MNEFMFLFRSDPAGAERAMGTPEQAQKSLEIWLAWIRELETSGHLKSRGQPLDRTGSVVRGQDRVVTDGPYVEVKDIVLGLITVEARDLAEATTLAGGCPIVAGGGSVEIRPVGRM